MEVIKGEELKFGCRIRWIYDEFPHFEKPPPDTPITFESITKREGEKKLREGKLQKEQILANMDVPPPYEHRP